MNEFHLKAALAGLFFGLWPLCMNRSGLNGYVSSACFALASLLGVLPFALASNGFTIPSANWRIVALAGLFGALGLMTFSGMLARVTPRDMGTLFVLMNLVQLAVAAGYQSYMDGSISAQKMGGYLAAALATYLLTR